MTIPVHSHRTLNDWGSHFRNEGARSSFQRCVTAGKTKLIWILDCLRGWFVIRFQEEGLQRNVGGGNEGAP